MALHKASHFFAVFALLLLSVPTYGALRHVPLVMHVQSTWSDDGTMTLDEIARDAQQYGIGAVLYNDHDIMKWEYGIWPLQHLVKKTITRTSVLGIGPDRYLREIADLNKKYPRLVCIPGVESAPFYYWSGSPFKDLTLNNWHKHLLISGLYGADVLRSLPLVGNERYAGKIDITLFWPVLLLLCGILFLNRSRKLGLLCAVAGIIFLFGNFPFKRLAYDQYHGDAGDLPYQSVIDYVNQTAPDTGMVFWAHPEAPNFDKKDKIGPVYLQTPEYPESLLRTDGYTGFGYFQEGERTVGRPGGVWDQILTDYVNHKRRSPVWAVAELDFRKEGYLGTFLDSFENIMLLAGDDPVNETTLIRTMKTGKFYALKNMHGSYGLVLDDLGISDGTNRVTMGETLVSRCSLCLSFSLSASDGKEHMVNSTIISNGTILERVQAVTPSVIQLPLPTPIAGAYYRIEIESDNHSKIVTNPVFIR